ncbi:DUF2470 domain-containing protein [Geodermatophilus sabuli]|uniref:DUF2470 domain-containing protein n=1 Tax=Geodermatophilus sabuli TaxID=1564158 RepID=A0A285EBX9_9ACTN|nr:DUF2470 domain-containing protein [Geodermatophilus sabuli]MBB3084240.1 hypothetical protein [Geodermatophilus sabuli]SNX96490.1 Protein of unknown function [Geodermatophilus sabuli]
MTTSPGRTPAPPAVLADPAERARTVASREAAALCVRGLAPSRPLAHATTRDGQVLVLVPSGGEVATALAAEPDLTTVLMVSDRAPVPLRDSLRAQLWLSGWLTPVHPADQRVAAVAFADVRPVGHLLDVGRGTTLLRLDLAEVVLREGTSCAEIGPPEYAAARPDPLAGVEAGMLRHLDRDHPEVLHLLRSRIPAGELGPRDVVRPLGIDRFGYRLRIERLTSSRDLRIPFPRPLTCPGQLHAATRQLLGAARAALARRD